MLVIRSMRMLSARFRFGAFLCRLFRIFWLFRLVRFFRFFSTVRVGMASCECSDGFFDNKEEKDSHNDPHAS